MQRLRWRLAKVAFDSVRIRFSLGGPLRLRVQSRSIENRNLNHILFRTCFKGVLNAIIRAPKRVRKSGAARDLSKSVELDLALFDDFLMRTLSKFV